MADLLAADRVDRARHDDRRQHDDPDDGRHDRAARHRGVPRRDRAAALLQGGHLGPGLPGAGADRPASGPPRDPRAAHRRRRGRDPARRGRGPRATRRLRAFGVTSIAVSFLHSYLNPDARAAGPGAVLEEYPDVELISLSHEVYPKPPEFERTSTTLVNAYVGPPIVRYLRPARGHAARRPVTPTSCSSPPRRGHRDTRRRSAAGRWPRSARARPAGSWPRPRRPPAPGSGDVVCVDMGGTTYDVCLIRDGRAAVTADWNWRHRYCIALPMVDIHSIGAGGGSVATSIGGFLQVGPDSAGSEPGPCLLRARRHRAVCHRRRPGPRPARPSGFYGGRLALDVDARRQRSATSLHRARTSTPRRPPRLVCDRRRPHDRRDPPRPRPWRVRTRAGLDLVAFGGMGAVHATDPGGDARHAPGARSPRAAARVLRPRARSPPIMSSTPAAPSSATGGRSTAPSSRALADELETAARAELTAAGVPADRVRLRWLVNLVYPGQTFDRALPLPRRPSAPITRDDVAAAVEAFHRENEAAPPDRGPLPGADGPGAATPRDRPRRHAGADGARARPGRYADRPPAGPHRRRLARGGGLRR